MARRPHSFISHEFWESPPAATEWVLKLNFAVEFNEVSKVVTAASMSYFLLTNVVNRIFLSLSPYDDLQQDTCIQFTTHLKHKLTFVEGWIDGHSAQSSVNPPHHCVLFGDTATEYLWMSDSLPRVIYTYILFDDDGCIVLVVTFHETSRTPTLLQDLHSSAAVDCLREGEIEAPVC